MFTTRTMLIATLATAAILVCASGAWADLVGYWNFDGNVADWSGMGNDGALLSGASYSGDFPAQLGGGQSLAVTSDGGGVVIGSPTGLNSSDFTLSYWIKDPGQAGAANRVTSRGGNSFETAVGSSGGYMYYPGGPGWGGGGIGTLTANTWTHVAYVHAGTTLRTYVDGALVYTGTVTLAPSGDMGIGVRITGGPGESFLGNIDDVAVWNQPLLGSSITSLAAGTQPPTAFTGGETGLVGYWNFDGNVLDHSNNSNDGTNLLNVSYSSNTPEPIGPGQSLVLGGSTRVDIPEDFSLNSKAFTLAYWFNQNGAVQNGPYERITSRGSDSFETAASGDGSFSIYSPGPGWADTGHDFPGSGWEHVAVTSNGATIRAYVDGVQVYSGPMGNAPSGILRIGARASVWTEGGEGLIDDVAMWNAPLTPSAVEALAAGKDAPTAFRVTTVGSDPARWTRSTVRKSGGAPGTWVPPSPLPADWLPDASTFTEAASSTTAAGIIAAGNDLLVGTLAADGGNGQPEGVQFYRTTFDLAPFEQISANIVLAADNGAQVFINGVEVARETSFLVENWARPYSSLTINDDGSITNLSLFDQVATSFTGWRIGPNELILAIRNPDSEALNGGGIAFRMDIVTSVPEPGSMVLLGLGGLGLALLRRRKREPV